MRTFATKAKRAQSYEFGLGAWALACRVGEEVVFEWSSHASRVEIHLKRSDQFSVRLGFETSSSS